MKNWIMPLLGIAVLGLAACSQPSESGETGSTSSTDKPAAGTSSTPVVAFAADIEPILQKNCISCHQGEGAKEGIDFSSHETIMKGGEHGAILVAGKSEESLMYKVLIGDGAKQMPPGDPISPSDVEKIKAWIDAGATK